MLQIIASLVVLGWAALSIVGGAFLLNYLMSVHIDITAPFLPLLIMVQITIAMTGRCLIGRWFGEVK